MDQATWMTLAALALSSGAGIVVLGSAAMDVILGFAGALMWALWGYGATNVEIYTEGGCCLITRSYPSLALLSVILIGAWAAIGVWGFDGLTRRIMELSGDNDELGRGGF